MKHAQKIKRDEMIFYQRNRTNVKFESSLELKKLKSKNIKSHF